MDAAELLAQLRLAGFVLSVVDGGRLGVAPARLLTDEDRAAITQHKVALVALLRNEHRLADALVVAVNRAHADMSHDRRTLLLKEVLDLPAEGQADMLAHFVEVARGNPEFGRD